MIQLNQFYYLQNWVTTNTTQAKVNKQTTFTLRILIAKYLENVAV